MNTYHNFANTVASRIKDLPFEVEHRTVNLSWIENSNKEDFFKNAYETREFLEASIKGWKFKPCYDLQYAFEDRDKYSLEQIIEAVKEGLIREVKQYIRIENELGHETPDILKNYGDEMNYSNDNEIESLWIDSEQEMYER